MRYYDLLETHNNLKYVMPNAEIEFDEAQRYDQLKHLSLEQWKMLVHSGYPTIASAQMLLRLGNTTASDQTSAEESFDELEPTKRARVLKALTQGQIEYPIVLKDGPDLDLLSGNTRLTALVARGWTPKVLIIDITEK